MYKYAVEMVNLGTDEYEEIEVDAESSGEAEDIALDGKVEEWQVTEVRLIDDKPSDPDAFCQPIL